MSPTTYSGASCSSAASRQCGAASVRPKIASTRSECCATEKACSPVVWPFQRATRARPWAMSSISMSSGEGEAARLELLRHGPRQGRLGRDLGRVGEAVLHGLAVDETPEEAREARPLHDGEPGAGAPPPAPHLWPGAH